MRGFLFGVVLTTVAIQGAPAPPLPLYGYLDMPSPFFSHPYTPDFKFSGWAMDCRTGELPPFVTVEDFWMGPDGTGMTLQEHTILSSFLLFRDEARPDVQAAAINTCPLASANTGYSIYPNAALKPGVHALWVMWSAGDGISRASAIWVVVPFGNEALPPAHYLRSR